MMKLLITGAGGQVGQAFMEVCAAARVAHVGLNRSQLDITDPNAIAAALDREQPDFVVNAASVSDVNVAQSDAALCYAINRDGVARLARACSERRIGLMILSTDQVFDGQQATPYSEQSKPNPQFVFGNSKYEGEEAVRELCPRHFVLRSSWLFSHRGNNFLTRALEKMQAREPISGVTDQITCPTWAGHLAAVGLGMIQQAYFQEDPPLWGTYHYCDRGATTRFDFARKVVEFAVKQGVGEEVPVNAIDSADLLARAEVPRHSVLSTDRIFFTFGIRQRSWRVGLKEALRAYQAERDVARPDNSVSGKTDTPA